MNLKIFKIALVRAKYFCAKHFRRHAGFAFSLGRILRARIHSGRHPADLGLLLSDRQRTWQKAVLLLWGQTVQTQIAVNTKCQCVRNLHNWLC